MSNAAIEAAKRIADKYISRDGSPPQTSKPKSRKIKAKPVKQ